ncbi:MAG: exosortase X [Crocinitomicaceae bacterium]
MFKIESKAFRFILLAVTLYIVWLLVYQFCIKVYTNADYALNYNIVSIANSILNVFGVTSYIDIDTSHVLLLKESDYKNAGVWVGDNCNGFKLFSIFSIFLIAFPGNWKSKLWYIPLGIAIVHLANVIRVIALFIISDTHPEWLDFNHLYTFTAFVYLVLFGLWIVWIKQYGEKLKDEQD